MPQIRASLSVSAARTSLTPQSWHAHRTEWCITNLLPTPCPVLTDTADAISTISGDFHFLRTPAYLFADLSAQSSPFEQNSGFGVRCIHKEAPLPQIRASLSVSAARNSLTTQSWHAHRTEWCITSLLPTPCPVLTDTADAISTISGAFHF
ncbi:hypothetical protein J2X61_006882 [Bacillus sp. 3255]|nr:hypothetical protein [Bacillus sp. 3255]